MYLPLLPITGPRVTFRLSSRRVMERDFARRRKNIWRKMTPAPIYRVLRRSDAKTMFDWFRVDGSFFGKSVCTSADIFYTYHGRDLIFYSLPAARPGVLRSGRRISLVAFFSRKYHARLLEHPVLRARKGGGQLAAQFHVCAVLCFNSFNGHVLALQPVERGTREKLARAAVKNTGK